MPKDIVIVSAGKFGREICAFVRQAIEGGRDWRIKGFLDSRADQLQRFAHPVPILSSVEDYDPAENDLFLCAIGSSEDRQRYTEAILRKGGRFATLVHPTAVLGDRISLGEGVIIAPYAVLTSHIVLGDSVYVGPHSLLSHDNEIGNWCQISGHCAIGGCVTMGESVFLGIGSIIMPDLKIGSNAFIGIGSVVIRNVGEGRKVFGNPAFPMGGSDGPKDS
jgi:sugar O-acyltransferase (sialic acid O-acetyltransferase NeuD family)